MTTIKTNTITWTLKNGSQVEVNVNLNTQYSGCSIDATAAIVGSLGVMAFDPTETKLSSGHPAIKAGATNGIGNLMWTAVNQAKIEAAIADLKTTPEWQTSVKGIDAAIKAAEFYDNATDCTVKAMIA